MNIERIEAEILHAHRAKRISEIELQFCKDNAQIHYHVDRCRRELIMSMDVWFAGIADHEVHIDEEYPATWWDAFKDRWFPLWLKLRFPPRYKRIFVKETIYKAVCPHLHVRGANDHVEFLYSASRNVEDFAFPNDPSAAMNEDEFEDE